MAEDLDSGLLGIGLSDSEDGDVKETVQPRTRAEKNAQSEAEFLALKRSYAVKVENGEIWKTVNLPLGESVSKPQAQALLHAVEELFFFRRYEEAIEFIRSVKRQGGDAGGGLDDDTRELLGYYERRCREKMEVKS